MTHSLLQEHADLATAVGILDDWIVQQTQQQHQPGLAIGLAHIGDSV